MSFFESNGETFSFVKIFLVEFLFWDISIEFTGRIRVVCLGILISLGKKDM